MQGGETPENINPAEMLTTETKSILEGLAKHTKETMDTGSDDPEAVLEALLQMFPEVARPEINQKYLRYYLNKESEPKEQEEN